MKAAVIEGLRSLPPGSVCVYGIGDPETRHLRYLGITNNPARRFREHYNRAMNQDGKTTDTHKHRWIRGLAGFGLQPLFKVLAVAQDATEAKRLERAYIQRCPGLTNGTGGGDGSWRPTPETRRKIGDVSRRMTPEQRAKRGAAISAALRSDPKRLAERNRKIGDALRGRKKSESHRRKWMVAMGYIDG